MLRKTDIVAKIEFKAKIQEMYDGKKYINVPVFKRSHCDMNEFRFHPKYGGYANSDLFPAMLQRIRKEVTGSIIYLDNIPENVSIDTSGFLAVVSFEV